MQEFANGSGARVRRLTHSLMQRLSLLGALLLASCAGAENEPRVPVVQIDRASTYDALCSLFGTPIDDEWVRELDSVLPAFRDEWQRFGEPILHQVVEITGRGFRASSIDVGLTLCGSPSESSWSGVRVNMRFALRRFTDTPVPLRYKVATLAHELLHVFLREHPVRDSTLLALHAAEPERVRNHLHLLALIKAALLRSNQPELLDEVVRMDSSLPSDAYRRAWAIVNVTPDAYLRYVEEIRAAAVR